MGGSCLSMELHQEGFAKKATPSSLLTFYLYIFVKGRTRSPYKSGLLKKHIGSRKLKISDPLLRSCIYGIKDIQKTYLKGSLFFFKNSEHQNNLTMLNKNEFYRQNKIYILQSKVTTANICLEKHYFG